MYTGSYFLYYVRLAYLCCAELRENQLCKQQLLVQVNENETVLQVRRLQGLFLLFLAFIVIIQELKTLESDAILYKLVGPILVPQSKDDAQSVVEKRLEYIATEM